MSCSTAHLSSVPLEVLEQIYTSAMDCDNAIVLQLVDIYGKSEAFAIRYRPLGKTSGIDQPDINHDDDADDGAHAIATWMALRSTDHKAHREVDRLFLSQHKFELKVLDYTCRRFTHNTKLDFPGPFVSLMRNITIIVPPWTNLWGDAWFDAWGDATPSRQALALQIMTLRTANTNQIVRVDPTSGDQATTSLATAIQSAKTTTVWSLECLMSISKSMWEMGKERDAY